MDKVIQELPPLGELGFGQYYGPLMASSEFKGGQWAPLKIQQVDNLKLHPGSKVLHYAQEIFEGLKAFRTPKGISLFRAKDNIRRMSRSAEIMQMAPFPESAFFETLCELIKQSDKFVPENPGALYVRPTMIGTSAALGVAPATEFLFYILLSPVGGYFGSVKSDVPAIIRCWISDCHVRAVRGGLGAAKTGANYAASLAGVVHSKKLGFDNVLFVDALERKFFEELSGMNIFVVDRGVLKTPPLGDTILAGITRDTILNIARSLGLKVQEGPIELQSTLQGIQSKSVTEAFACGTGAAITSISEFGYKNERFSLGAEPGPISTQLYRELTAQQSGRKAPLNAEWIHTL